MFIDFSRPRGRALLLAGTAIGIAALAVAGYVVVGPSRGALFGPSTDETIELSANEVFGPVADEVAGPPGSEPDDPSADALPGSSTRATEPPRTQAIFTDPLGDTAAKNRIFTRLVELINGAETGSTIRVATYYIVSQTVPKALIAAKARGVNVQVITDEKTKDNTATYHLLRTGLGTDTSKGSFFMTCPANRGCIASVSNWSIMHNKFYLFTRTLGVSNVVVQTSMNLGGTNYRDGGKGWNDALIVTGHDALFTSYSGYFADLKAQRVNNNYYDSGRQPYTTGRAKVFYYPRAGSSVHGDPAENTIMTILNNTECRGNTSVGTSGEHRTVIRVTMMALDLQYLADRLDALDAAGCDVLVNLRVDTGNARQVAALGRLLRKTSSVLNGVIVTYYCMNDPIWIHAKHFSIEGKYYGRPDQRLVWTGSHNWTGGSLRGSDEIMLQMNDRAVFDAYRANFTQVANAATHKPKNGGTVTC